MTTWDMVSTTDHGETVTAVFRHGGTCEVALTVSKGDDVKITNINISDSDGVSSNDVREIPIGHLKFRASSSASTHDMNVVDVLEPVPDDARTAWPKNPHLACEWVAKVYENALHTEIPAQQAVQDAFGVSRATAGRMVSKSRELGYIQLPGVTGRPRGHSRRT